MYKLQNMSTIRMSPAIAALALLCSSFCIGQSSAEKTMGIRIVLDKLDTFAAKELSKSDLTFADLQVAYTDFQKWDPAFRHKLQKEQPPLHYLSEYLLKSMGKNPNILTNGIDVTAGESFIRKLEKCYKDFKLGYFNSRLCEPEYVPTNKPGIISERTDYNPSEPPKSSITMAVEIVLDKLESFVIKMLLKSDLTFADLQAAYLDFHRLEPSYRNKLKHEQPLLHMLSDFLFVPMEKQPNIFTNGIDVELGNKFIRRLERHYKEFRPAYLGHLISGPRQISIKIDSLVSALDSNNKQALTNKIFSDASEEYEALLNRFYEIGEDGNIFGNIDELRKILNSINRVETIILRRKIIPLALDMNESSLPYLRDVFANELSKLGLTTQRGEIKKTSQRVAS